MRRLWIWLVIAAVLVALVGAFILRNRLNRNNSTVTPSQQVQGSGFAPIDVADATQFAIDRESVVQAIKEAVEEG